MGLGAARPKRNHQEVIIMRSQTTSHSGSTGRATAAQTVRDPAFENVGAWPPTLTQAIPPAGVAAAAAARAGLREAEIATAAYYRAEQRCFAPGNELADWLAAEREVDRL